MSPVPHALLIAHADEPAERISPSPLVLVDDVVIAIRNAPNQLLAANDVLE